MAQPQPGSVGQVLGAGHGAASLAAIGPLGGRRVCVQADEAMGREPGGGERHMEAAGQVSGDVRIGLEMGRERR